MRGNPNPGCWEQRGKWGAVGSHPWGVQVPTHPHCLPHSFHTQAGPRLVETSCPSQEKNQKGGKAFCKASVHRGGTVSVHASGD